MKLSLNLSKPQLQPLKSPLQRTSNFSLLSVRKSCKQCIPRHRSLDNLQVDFLSVNYPTKHDFQVTSDSALDFDADINVPWQFVKSLEQKTRTLRLMESRILTCFQMLSEQYKIMQNIQHQQSKAMERLRKPAKAPKSNKVIF